MNLNMQVLVPCAISGLFFFLLGLMLGRWWRASANRPRRQDFRRPPFQGKPMPPRREGPVEIYVGNLPLEVTKDELEREFGKFGKVQNIRLITKHGENKSFGFVEMAVPSEAEAAIEAFAGKDYKGNELEVNVAKSPRGHRRHHRH